MDYAVPTQLFNYLTNLINIPFLPESWDKYVAFLPIFLIGFISTLILAPIIGKIAWKHGYTYKPGIKRVDKDFDNPEKALHEGETPALGGLSITIPAFIIMTLSFQLNSFTIPILLALLILIIGSALDDIYNLDSKIQLLFQVVASAIIMFSVIDLSQIGIFSNELINLSAFTWQFNLLGLPLSLALPGDIFLFFWLMLCINSVKWVGGSPGLIESYSSVIFMLLFIIGIRVSSDFSATTAIVITGSLIMFLMFAVPPQKIMSGSPGKSVFGFVIALLALISDSKISTSIMLIGLPLLDALYVVIRRIIVHKPKSLVELMKINDATHFHHQLLKLKLSRRQILLVEGAIALFVGSIAIATTGALRYFLVILGLTVLIMLIAIINFKASQEEKKKKEESPESKYSY